MGFGESLSFDWRRRSSAEEEEVRLKKRRRESSATREEEKSSAARGGEEVRLEKMKNMGFRKVVEKRLSELFSKS